MRISVSCPLLGVALAVMYVLGWFAYLRLQATNEYSTSRCRSPTMSIYSDAEVGVLEKFRSKFEFNLVAEATALYDKLNLPGIKGATIWDELRPLREPQCQGNRDCFALWKPIFSCKEKMLLGGTGKLDGSRFLCSSSAFATRKPCIIYSIGSNGDFDFEDSLLQATQSCTVHTFDCTMGQTGAYNKTFERKDRHFFHPWCLSALNGEPNSNYMTLDTMHKRLKHSWGTLALLKLDIEAFEHKVLGNFQKSDRFLPEQLTLEVHSTTEPISGSYRYKSIGELTLFLLQMMRLGYRLVHVQDEGGGVDATFIRVLC